MTNHLYEATDMDMDMDAYNKQLEFYGVYNKYIELTVEMGYIITRVRNSFQPQICSQTKTLIVDVYDPWRETYKWSDYIYLVLYFTVW